MKIKKYLLGILVISLMVPSVVLASWWNPISWKIFNFIIRKDKEIQTPSSNSNNYEEKISELQKQIEDLKLQQSNSTQSSPLNKDEIRAQIEKEVKSKIEQNSLTTREKTLSEKVGVSRESLGACIKSTDTETLRTKISSSVEKAMEALSPNERGTPYAIIIGSNGIKTEIRGAFPAEEVNRLIEEVKSGKVTTEYKGKVVLSEPGDNLKGSANAQVKIIEYSDFECPYCKIFHETMKKVVADSKGSVSWVYRHWPIHQNSFEKLVAAECVSKIKGGDAFWKYVDLLFGMLNPEASSVSDKL